MSTIRTRWAAIGAAVAVTLGGGGIGLVTATAPSGAVAYTPITPCRIVDTRPAYNVGPRATPVGGDETLVVDAHGSPGECVDITNRATGLQLNVTALDASTDTFLSVWGGGERPNAASLNPSPGEPPTPNAVTTGVNDTGEFRVYNRFGTVHVVIDVVGVYTDHNHDDRYHTKADLYVKQELYPKGQLYTRDEVDDLLARTRPLAYDSATDDAPDVPPLNAITVRSVTATAPVGGTFHVSGVAHISNGAGSATCSLRLVKTTLTGSGHRSDVPASCSTLGSIEVDPGAHTFELVVGSGNGVTVDDAALHVLFVPLEVLS